MSCCCPEKVELIGGGAYPAVTSQWAAKLNCWSEIHEAYFFFSYFVGLLTHLGHITMLKTMMNWILHNMAL